MTTRQMAKSYSTINQDFFYTFNQDQQDEVIELMDRFEEAVGNSVMVARVAFMNIFSHLSFDDQRFIAGCLLCNTLAQSAQIFWEKCWKNEKGHGISNHYIDSIRHCSKLLLNLNYSGEGVNCNDDPACVNAVNALSGRIVSWLKEGN